MLWLILQMWMLLILSALIGVGATVLALRPWAKRKAAVRPAADLQKQEALIREKRRLEIALAEARNLPAANMKPAIEAVAQVRAEIAAMRRALDGHAAEEAAFVDAARSLGAEARGEAASDEDGASDVRVQALNGVAKSAN